MQTFRLEKFTDRTRILAKIASFLSALAPTRGWVVEVKELRPKRTDSQNRMLWSLYEEILARGSEELGGWTKEDLHGFFLISHFGSEVRELFGKKRHVPLRTSSKLSTKEFTLFVEHIVQFMAERGICLQMPGENYE